MRLGTRSLTSPSADPFGSPVPEAAGYGFDVWVFLAVAITPPFSFRVYRASFIPLQAYLQMDAFKASLISVMLPRFLISMFRGM